MFNKSCSTIPIAIGRATFAFYMYLLVSPYQAFNFSIEVQRYFLFDNLQILNSKKNDKFELFFDSFYLTYLKRET